MRKTSFRRTIFIATAASGLTLFGAAIANADTGSVHQDRVATTFQADDSVAPVTQFSAALNRSLLSGQRNGLDRSILSTTVHVATSHTDQGQSTTTSTRTTEKKTRHSSNLGADTTGYRANRATQANDDLTATIRVGSASDIGLSADGIDRNNGILGNTFHENTGADQDERSFTPDAENSSTLNLGLLSIQLVD